MKQIITLTAIFTSLSVFSSNAPVLEKVAENVEASFYIYKATLRRSEDIADFWQVIDYKDARLNKNGEKYRSMEMHITIDCAKYKQNLIYIKVYSANMANGKIIANGSMNQRNDIPIGSTLEIVKNHVCR